MLAVSTDKAYRRLAIEALEAWGEKVDCLRVAAGLVDDDEWDGTWEPSRSPDDEPPF
ncbi:hypothetical protein Acsp03_56320 [Actinomadura sp. NBRC 104412]|nr:hypothetical protein Acsp03_56320 [Actinomadura sp. NBRC 104412]